MSPFGPFEVDPADVSRLGPSFTEFVNRLLDAECSRAGLFGRRLTFDYRQNVADGGVDAAIVESIETDWLPAGDSVWQFKSGQLFPAACADELRNATWVHQRLLDGASYVLAIGVQLGDRAIANREKALREECSSLGIALSSAQMIQVLDATKLARWASSLPALAVSALFQRPGHDAQDFSRWSRSNRHRTHWVTNAAKESALQAIRENVADPTLLDLRVQGESGLGKTRLVMETFRGHAWRDVVVYLPDPEHASDLLSYLTAGRTAIVIVDECDSRVHEKLAERIPEGSSTKLITIGELSSFSLITPIIAPGRLEEEDVEAFLVANYHTLWQEARRLVATYCQGNVRYAQIIADKIRSTPDAQAADLIERGDIETFVTDLLPEGDRSFFLAGLMALFEKVGWEQDVESHLELLARFGHSTSSEMKELGHRLESGGLLVRRGRYRAIGPNPLAVFLAASVWRDHGQELVQELLPNLDYETMLSLLVRAGQLGSYGPTREVLESLLGPDSPFGSLASIEEHGLAPLLTQLAIIAPDATAQHLADLISVADLSELTSQTDSRRHLVWGLEKLAWHSRTFDLASDCLLRLALAENETYANNATSTWLALFGAALPATSASPEQRLSYLNRHANEGLSTRLLVTKACAHGLSGWESITVSGELQGGVVVEPRGGVHNDQERGAYRKEAIALLDRFASDSDSVIAEAACDSLISAVHQLIADHLVGDTLSDALVHLKGAELDKLREKIEHLRGLFMRHPNPPTLEAIEALSARLEPLQPTEELRLLLQASPWELEGSGRKIRILELTNELAVSDGLAIVVAGLREREPQSAWHLGHAISRLSEQQRAELAPSLISSAPISPSALAGYLAGRAESGDVDSFDLVLESERLQISVGQALSLTVQGPATPSAVARVQRLIAQLPTSEGVNRSFGWYHKVGDLQKVALLKSWILRLESQLDYDALIDWVNLVSYSAGIPNAMREDTLNLILRRTDFPEMLSQRWDWCRLAEQFIVTNATDLASLVIDFAAEDYGQLSSDHEAGLLRKLAGREPDLVWAEVTKRLERGDWQLEYGLRGWFIDALAAETIETWIGTSPDRAKIVARITAPGSSSPTPIARFLLANFETIPEVGQSLASAYFSDSWMGPHSNRLAQRITELKGWRADGSVPTGVKRWALAIIQDLESQRASALRQEEERGW